MPPSLAAVSASLATRAWLWAGTIRSVLGAISEELTSLGFFWITTSMPAAFAAAARRSSASCTTTRAISTPCVLSMLSVVTPKWREPTRVIRMVFLSLGQPGVSGPASNNTPRASLAPKGRKKGGLSTRHVAVLPWRDNCPVSAPDCPGGNSPNCLVRVPAGARYRQSIACASAGRELISVTVLLAQQPAGDDVPFVAAPGLEIQETGLVVLKFKIEFQRVPPGGTDGVNGLRLQPLLPFPDDQNLGFL